MATSLAFLCHSSTDKVVVEKLARGLKANGVDVWYDDWRIEPGDSLRRKIEKGIGDATHFLAILTPASIKSEWAQTELDAATVRRIEGACRLIPVVLGVDDGQVPLTLRSLLWVRLEPYDEGLRRLVDACHGVSREPPLGKPPTSVVQPRSLGLSPEAERLARFLCERSPHGHPLGFFSFDQVLAPADLTEDELLMAVDELVEAGLIKDGHAYARRVMPEWELFFQLDPLVKGTDPEEDAIRVATEVANASDGALKVTDIATQMGWDARRLNPACGYLVSRDIVNTTQAMGSGPYCYAYLRKTPRTVRFVRGNSR